MSSSDESGVGPPKRKFKPIHPQICLGSGGGYIPSRKEKKAEEHKKVFRWIDGGTLMERWGIDAGILAYLIFECGLQALDVQRVTWIVTNPGPHAWMAEQGAFMTRSDWGTVTAFPIEDQKRIVCGMVKFDIDDIEAFESEHEELVSKSKAVTTENKSQDSLNTSIKQTKTVSGKFTLKEAIIHYKLLPNQIVVLTYWYDQTKLTKLGKLALTQKKAFVYLQQHHTFESDQLKDVFKRRPQALKDLFIREKRGLYSLNFDRLILD